MTATELEHLLTTNSIREIARMHNVQHTTIRYWVRRHGLMDKVQHRQYLFALKRGWIHPDGTLVNERIPCGCGCGQQIWRFYRDVRGVRRERRCLKWHNVSRPCSSSPRSNLNRQKRRQVQRDTTAISIRKANGDKALFAFHQDEIASDDFLSRANDRRTRLAIEIAKEISRDRFYEHVGDAYIALEEADADRRVDAKQYALERMRAARRVDNPDGHSVRYGPESNVLAVEDENLLELFAT